MGNITHGFAVYDDLNVTLPPEILEIIVGKMSFNDKLAYREVCHSWKNYLEHNPSIFPIDSVALHVDKIGNEGIIETFCSESSRKWSNLVFENMELNETTFECIKSNSDFIKRLVIKNCQGPPQGTPPTTVANLLDMGKLGICPNLEYFTFAGELYKAKKHGYYYEYQIKCSKISNSLFNVQPNKLHELFFLENITHLDFSYNKAIKNDTILFSILFKINRLVSLNLSGLDFSFDRRFNINEDDSLHFDNLYAKYLATPRAKDLKKFYMWKTNINNWWIEKLSSNDLFQWETISLLKLKKDHINKSEILLHNFIQSQIRTLKEIHFTIKDLAYYNYHFRWQHMEFKPRQHEVFKNIKVLEILGLNFTQDFLGSLESLEELITNDNHIIAPDDTQLPSYALHNLPHPQKLKRLHLELNKYSSINKNEYVTAMLHEDLKSSFLHFPNLTSLSIEDLMSAKSGSIDLLIQSIISNCKSLRILKIKLNSLELTDFGVAGMLIDEYDDIEDSDFMEISKQNFQIYMENPEKGSSLSSLKYLRELSLVGCTELSLATFKHGIHHQFLERLKIKKCRGLGEIGISHIVQNCPSLTHVDISHCPHAIYSPKAMKLVKSLPRLRRLTAKLNTYCE